MNIGVSGTNKVKTECLGQAGEVRITEKMNELTPRGWSQGYAEQWQNCSHQRAESGSKKLAPLPG